MTTRKIDDNDGYVHGDYSQVQLNLRTIQSFHGTLYGVMPTTKGLHFLVYSGTFVEQVGLWGGAEEFNYAFKTLINRANDIDSDYQLGLPLHPMDKYSFNGSQGS